MDYTRPDFNEEAFQNAECSDIDREREITFHTDAALNYKEWCTKNGFNKTYPMMVVEND